MAGMQPLSLAALLLAGAPAAGGAVVEEIVAVVRTPAGPGTRVLTLTKVEEETRIALVSRGAIGAADGPLDEAALRAGLEWLVDQTILADEAERLRVAEVRREEADAELQRFRSAFPSPAAYAAFLARADLPEEELLATLARTIRVRRYLESRVGRGARPSEEDVDRLLREREGGPGAPVTREAARTRLVEERAAAQVGELLAELRSRAEIRILRRFGAGGAPVP